MSPEGGRIEDGQHVFALRVYYEDTDAGGVVYYANYLKFAERGRTEMLRAAGIDHGELARSHGLSFVVRDCTLDCRRSARLDDVLEVRSRPTGVGAASLRVGQVIARDGLELVRLGVRVACLDRGGRPARIPGPLREAFAERFESSPRPST
jgi:acyl-CoA thioester hydrolase